MLKRKLIILSLLVVAFLICSQSTLIVEAKEQTKKKFRTGNTVAECIFLEEGLYIKVIRSASDLCAERVEQHSDAACTTKVYDIKRVYKYDPGKYPKTEAYGIGNQTCKESIVPSTKKNPRRCFEYHSGCRTRYIPRG